VSTSTIIVAKRSEESRIASLMTLAFTNDPVMRYLYPDQLQFLTHFPEFVRLFGGKAFDRGSAYMTTHGLGAALWLPPDEQPDEEALIELVKRSAADAAKAELFQVFQQMSSYHPEEPHWYRPVVVYHDPYSRFFWWWLLDRSLDDQAWWATFSTGDSF